MVSIQHLLLRRADRGHWCGQLLALNHNPFVLVVVDIIRGTREALCVARGVALGSAEQVRCWIAANVLAAASRTCAAGGVQPTDTRRGTSLCQTVRLLLLLLLVRSRIVLLGWVSCAVGVDMISTQRERALFVADVAWPPLFFPLVLPRFLAASDRGMFGRGERWLHPIPGAAALGFHG